MPTDKFPLPEKAKSLAGSGGLKKARAPVPDNPPARRELTKPRREGATKPLRTLLGPAVPPRPLESPGAPRLERPTGTTNPPPPPLTALDDPDSAVHPVSSAPPTRRKPLHASDPSTPHLDWSGEEATTVYESPLVPDHNNLPKLSALPSDLGGTVPLIGSAGPSTGTFEAENSTPFGRSRREAEMELTPEPSVIVHPEQSFAIPRSWRVPAALTGLVGCAVVTWLSLRGPQTASNDRPAATEAPTRAPALPNEPATTAAPIPSDQPELVQAPERPDTCDRWLASLADAPTSAEQAKSAWHLARKALQTGNIERAEERFCQSVHYDVHGKGTPDLVRHYFATGNTEAGTAWARWAHHEDPKNPTLQRLLADALAQAGDAQSARELLLQSMDLTETKRDVIRSVANRYALSGFSALDGRDPPRARRLFDRAVVLDENNGLAHAGLALALGKVGEKEHVLKLAKRAVELAPDAYHSHLAMAEALTLAGDQTGAAAERARARALNPSSRR